MVYTPFGVAVVSVLVFWAFTIYSKIRALLIISSFALIVLGIKIINSYIDFWIFAVLLVVTGLITFMSAITSR